MKYTIVFLLILAGCGGVSRYSAETAASYQTPDGTIVKYTSNKEHEGVVVEIKEFDGKSKTITIKVESAGTSEAAIAAMSRAQASLAEVLEKLVPIIAKGAMAGS